MEHTARVHDVEAAVDVGQLDDVGFGEGDVVQSERQRLALGVAETRQAEIDGQNPRPFELPRGLDQILPRAAARDEDVDPVRSAQSGMRLEPVPEIFLHGRRSLLPGPALPIWDTGSPRTAA